MFVCHLRFHHPTQHQHPTASVPDGEVARVPGGSNSWFGVLPKIPKQLRKDLIILGLSAQKTLDAATREWIEVSIHLFLVIFVAKVKKKWGPFLSASWSSVNSGENFFNQGNSGNNNGSLRLCHLEHPQHRRVQTFSPRKPSSTAFP